MSKNLWLGPAMVAAAIAWAAVGVSCAHARVIANDRGGVIQSRVAEIAALRASGERVELRGEICLSTCTMFLGLPSACVYRGTTFGFHGPSSYGRPLPPADFEHWSTVMAEHYPQPLRGWFLRDARHTVRGYIPVTGAELVRIGAARECGA